MARGIQSYRSQSISTQFEIPPIVAGKRDLALVILVLALGRTSPQALSTASRLDTSVPERRCTHISYFAGGATLRPPATTAALNAE